MHTIMVLAGGFLLLAVCLLVGRWRGGDAPHPWAIGAKVFVPLWLIAAFINMWIGVRHAEYTWADEFPIFLIVFAVPAMAAAFLWWKYG